MPYTPRQPSKSHSLELRDYRYHYRVWGTPNELPTLFLLHGWMDVGASFQFMVDAMQTPRHIIAPDWRGFGQSVRVDGKQSDAFHHVDYLADLDALVQRIAGEAQIDLLGHSMGGNIAMLYAGLRPERVRRLVNLEGFGLPKTEASQAPARYTQWLDELVERRRGAIDLKAYPDAAAVAARLQKNNPRLNAEQAAWLAQHWAAPAADGSWRILGEAGHKVVNPTLYRVDEVLAVHARITAPVLSVVAEDSEMQTFWKGRYDLAEYHERLGVVPQVQHVTVANAGHMLHHDQPALCAQITETFLA